VNIFLITNLCLQMLHKALSIYFISVGICITTCQAIGENAEKVLNKGYWMSDGLILHLLNELNKIIICELSRYLIKSANDVTSKGYYTSVISFLLNAFITLLRRNLCDKVTNTKMINTVYKLLLRYPIYKY
jgi:hypothetical protein